MEANKYPGKLIAVEGLDGSGKTTQIRLLQNWLEAQGWPALICKRKTSKLISKKINDAKREKLLNPITYSLIHAADFAEVYDNEIIPALKSGFVVIFNKYVYTSLAKDYLRGNDRQWVTMLYDFALVPDITIYLKSTLEMALENMARDAKERDFYDSGMDLGMVASSQQSLKMFQKKLMAEYDGMVKKYNFKIVSGLNSIQEVQNEFRGHISNLLK